MLGTQAGIYHSYMVSPLLVLSKCKSSSVAIFKMWK